MLDACGSIIGDGAVVHSLWQPLDALREGFHNLPMLQPHVPSCTGTHLIPWLLGREIACTGDAPSTFTTWTRPLASLEEIASLRMPDLQVHPYGMALKAAIEAFPTHWQAIFPVLCAGGSPIDAAADILGTTEFYCALHTDPDAAHALIDCCTDVVIALYTLQQEACANGRCYHGILGIYVNDLVTEYLSAAHWRDFVLPCYRRLARAAGGIVLGANAPDPAVLPEVAAMEGFLGCTVHKAVPWETVIDSLRGRGVYILNSHPFDSRFNGPTLHQGAYYNPIVAYPYVNYREIHAKLAGEVALLVNLDRPNRLEALTDARDLLI